MQKAGAGDSVRANKATLEATLEVFLIQILLQASETWPNYLLFKVCEVNKFQRIVCKQSKDVNVSG